MRLWIFRALCSVVIDKTYSNLYLKAHLNEVDKKDQALCTRIFYGTIQNYLYCQYIWKQFASKKVDKKIDVLLTMSVYQLKFLDKVPTYAVCNEAVVIAKKVNYKSAGFVNAILRKVIASEVEYPTNPVERLSIETSTPSWLINMWKALYGFDKAIEMAHATNQILPVTVRRNTLKITEADFLNDDSFTKLQDSDLYIYKGDDFSNHPYYSNGFMSAQDEGSYQIACYLDVHEGMSVLDACSAPGTKAMSLAEFMNNKGNIDCLDIHEHRVKLIENDAKRLGVTIVHPMRKDARKLDDLRMYDRVLCDVPCSGYGVLARKPDIKLHMRSQDMDDLIVLQQEILNECAKHVLTNGILIYSTCTINKKENEKQIEKFLKDHEDFEWIDSITLFPKVGKDGFYIAKLLKK